MQYVISKHSMVLFLNLPVKQGMEMFGFLGPRSARRVPQPHRELLSEPVFEPEAHIWRPTSWRAPGGARNGGNRRSRRALRGVLSFGSFSLHDKQEKGTQGAGAEPPAISFSLSP